MIHQQTFDFADLPIIGLLILLEGLLSADNALVLAIMVKHLPEKLRHKALLYGLGGAFVFRAVAILLATFIMQLWWLQAIGALYLVWITVKHFFLTRSHEDVKEAGQRVTKLGFWPTVAMVEVTDIAFAVDSVLAAVSLAKTSPNVVFESKLWVVYSGAIIGVVLLRFAATLFLRILDKYPKLEHLAYLLVGWAGVKLLVFAAHNWSVTAHSSVHIPEMSPILFWTVLALIVVGGSWYSFKHADESDEVIREAHQSAEEAERADHTPIAHP